VLEAPSRIVSVAAKGFGIAGAVVAIGIAALLAHRFLVNSKELAIQSIEVHGQKRASKESIMRLANVKMGSNIFTADVDEIAKNVRAHPWVKETRVVRRYPHVVEIDIVEHEPAVVVALGHLYYANGDGEIVKRYTPGEHEDLAVVTGLSRDEMESDDGEARARLRSAIAFLHDVKEVLKDEAPRIAEIHLDPVLGLSFVAAGEQASVLVGLPPWKQRLERVLEVKEALQKKGVHASKIMLGGERRPDRAVARLTDAVNEGDRSAEEKHTEHERAAALSSLE
jgi:hypothetical protein